MQVAQLAAGQRLGTELTAVLTAGLRAEGCADGWAWYGVVRYMHACMYHACMVFGHYVWNIASVCHAHYAGRSA